MTSEEAQHIVGNEPWRWPEILSVAQQCLDIAVEHPVGNDQAAARAVNLMCLLVSLTGTLHGAPCPTCKQRKDFAGPHGRDVLLLYVTALRLLTGRSPGKLLTTHPLYGGMCGDWRDLGPMGCVALKYQAKLLGTSVECGPVCPPLPEIKWNSETRSYELLLESGAGN